MKKRSLFYQQIKLNMMLYPENWYRKIEDDSFHSTYVNYRRKYKTIVGVVDRHNIRLRLNDSFFDFFDEVESNSGTTVTRDEFKLLWKYLGAVEEAKAARSKKEYEEEISKKLNESNSRRSINNEKP